jgi:hypothetical protein
MADKVETNSSDGSLHRVALDLALRIYSSELSVTKDRTYWLNLYAQCRRVVLNGMDAKSAQEQS